MEDIRSFMGFLWVQKENDVYTIGLMEEALEDFESISAVDLPNENSEIEADVAVGSLETDEGALDIYSPVAGVVIEINQAVIEEPSLIVDDPTGDGWLFKVESEDDYQGDEDDDEDDDDEDDDLEEEEEEE